MRAISTPDRLAAMLVAVLALVTHGTALTHGFPLDDEAIIRLNGAVHGLGAALRAWASPYWPPAYHPDLYRPLAIVAFAAQWWAGAGGPLLFHAVSLALLAAVAVTVRGVAARYAGVTAATLAAAWFAVHPLRVEVAAAAVNQSELVVALVALAVFARWAADAAPGPIDGLLLAAATALGCGFKETGVVVPLVAVAARPLRSAAARPSWRTMLAHLAPAVAVAAAYVGWRAMILGSFAGSFAAEGLRGAPLGTRLATALAIVPRAVREVIWPVAVRADYSPAEALPAGVSDPRAWLGLALLVAGAWLAWRARARAPLVTAGLALAALGWLPVSNLLVPTGVLLAARVLLLPCAGLALAAAGVATWVAPRLPVRVRVAGAAAGAVAAVALAWTSAALHPAWRDTATLWRHEVATGNRSYRLPWLEGKTAAAQGRHDEALVRYAEARRRWADDPQLWVSEGVSLGALGDVDAAVARFRAALVAMPALRDARVQWAVALAWAGDYAGAAAVAREGPVQGPDAALFAQLATFADSAARLGRPAGSVNLYPLYERHIRTLDEARR